MTRGFSWWLALAVGAASWVAAAGAPLELTDDRGRVVELPQPASRIVALAPHLTELLFAAGAGARLVGAVDYSDFPPAAHLLPRVGGAAGIDIERLLALRPDLVVAWGSGTDPRTATLLESLGVPVYVVEIQAPADIPRQLRQLAVLSGTPSIGEEAARNFSEHLERLGQQHAGGRSVAVFVQIGEAPLMTVSGRHVISALVELCGGHNVFGDLRALTPVVSVEAVLSADPDLIIAAGAGAERWLESWRPWRTLGAVAREHLVVIPPDWLLRPGPRLLLGAQQLCRAIGEVRRGHDDPDH